MCCSAVRQRGYTDLLIAVAQALVQWLAVAVLNAQKTRAFRSAVDNKPNRRRRHCSRCRRLTRAHDLCYTTKAAVPTAATPAMLRVLCGGYFEFSYNKDTDNYM